MADPAPDSANRSTSLVPSGRLEVGKLAYEEARHAFELVNAAVLGGDEPDRADSHILGCRDSFAGQVLLTALSDGERLAAIAAGVVTAAFCIYTIISLMPAKDWACGIEGKRIVELYVDADVGSSDAVGAYEKVAKLISEDANDNQVKTDVLLRKVPIVGGLAAGSFCSWLALAVATTG